MALCMAPSILRRCLLGLTRATSRATFRCAVRSGYGPTLSSCPAVHAMFVLLLKNSHIISVDHLKNLLR